MSEDPIRALDTGKEVPPRWQRSQIPYTLVRKSLHAGKESAAREDLFPSSSRWQGSRTLLRRFGASLSEDDGFIDSD
jgi:hypothetical protein